MNTTSFYVVVLRDNGGRLIGNSFDNAVAKAKSHPGSTIRKASKEDILEYQDAKLVPHFFFDNQWRWVSNGKPVYVLYHRLDSRDSWEPVEILIDEEDWAADVLLEDAHPDNFKVCVPVLYDLMALIHTL